MSAKLDEGTVFAARYRIVRCLAAGGMGAVYEAIHLETDRRRALKVMHPHLFQSEEMRERFKREARIAAQVDSEYIVDVSDAGVDEATQMPFMVMELLRGEELGDRLKRLGRLPPEEVVTYMQQAAWALDRTHAASIVHRDLKPANLFLTMREDGTPRIKILDFGVAKLVAEGATAAGATQSLGTPIYMAPEQFRSNTKLTAAADIHALTQMTYTLLVGKAYWADEAKNAGDVIAFAMAAINGPQESAVARAARHGVTLPPGFDAWFAKGTAVNPADRFPSATEAVRALRAIGGSTSPGVAPMAPRPMMASDTGMPSPLSRPALASAPMLERAVTSTGASAITTAPIPRSSRAPLLGAAAVVGLGVLGTGAWLALRQGHANPETTNQIAAAPNPAAPAVTSAAPVVEVASAAVVTPPAPSVTASALATPAPAPTAPKATSTGAVAGAKTPTKPAAAPKPPVVTKPVADENYTRR
jgi:eukaryotic-like serine/threonine-protein kinase